MPFGQILPSFQKKKPNQSKQIRCFAWLPLLGTPSDGAAVRPRGARDRPCGRAGRAPEDAAHGFRRAPSGGLKAVTR